MARISLEHIIREPIQPGAGMPPLAILLHGVGSNELDLMGLADQLDPRLFLVSARAPITRQPGSYAWYPVEFTPDGFLIDEDDVERSRIGLLRFVDEVTHEYAVDPDRVFLLGFSQGAIMSLAAALTEPERFAGVVALSGRLLPTIAAQIAPPERLRKLSILALHGTADRVIPIDYGRELRDQLELLPLRFEYHEFPIGHWVAPESLAEIGRWFSEQL